jgi:hypothetical protein
VPTNERIGITGEIGMSQYTDQYEVDPKDYQELGHHMDNRYSVRGKKTDWVTTILLATLNLLAAACVIGIITMQGKIEAIDTRLNGLDNEINMIVDGGIRIPNGR